MTHIAATVIRIATGEGTLAIEVDDPSVHVSIDGEDVTISGAGIQELKLRPGQYSLRATRDGAPVKQELVTVTRGARRVVRVIRESAVPRPALPWDEIVPAGSPPPAIAPFDAAKAKEYQVAWAKHLGVSARMENSIGMKLHQSHVRQGRHLVGVHLKRGADARR